MAMVLLPRASGAHRRRSLSSTARSRGCRRCPRLVAWREQVARERRAAFAGERVLGAAAPGLRRRARAHPAAGPRARRARREPDRADVHGRPLGRLPLRRAVARRARQPAGLGRVAATAWSCSGVRITAAVRCAPPANKPTPAERDNCLPWTLRELELLPAVAVVVCLGAFAWDAAPAAAPRARRPPAPPPGGRGRASATAPRLPGEPWPLLGCYHPSQQNTFTGKLTPADARRRARPRRSRSPVWPRAGAAHGTAGSRALGRVAFGAWPNPRQTPAASCSTCSPSAADRLNSALGLLGAAYELLDERAAEQLEDELFGPVQHAYGRLRRTYSEFAARHGLPAREFPPAPEAAPGHGVHALIDDAIAEMARGRQPSWARSRTRCCRSRWGTGSCATASPRPAPGSRSVPDGARRLLRTFGR